MPEWITADLGVTGLIICAIVYVAVTYINKRSDKISECDRTGRCSENMIPHVTDSVRTNTELITVLKDQQAEFRRYSEKQQEALHGLVLAINNLITLQHETLDRVKSIEKSA